MSFRRSKSDAQLGRSWKKFLEANKSLLLASGVPVSIFGSRDLFDDLLMHGDIDHHKDPTRFSVDELSASQYDAFLDAAALYLRAGFPNPWISLPTEGRE